MSKSVAVIDTPENGCMDCIICRSTLFKTICGITGNGVSGIMNEEVFPEDCPLKPMPEKFEYTPMHHQSYVCGWNDCIDAIKGENEDG